MYEALNGQRELFPSPSKATKYDYRKIKIAYRNLETKL